MKRILPLILVALMIISLSSCSNPKFEHPISVSKLTDGDLKSVMLDYENDLMLELLNKGKWVDDIPNCGYDYEFEFGAHNVLRYHSECGTFIDTENSRSLTVSEQDKNTINESLNRSIESPSDQQVAVPSGQQLAAPEDFAIHFASWIDGNQRNIIDTYEGYIQKDLIFDGISKKDYNPSYVERCQLYQFVIGFEHRTDWDFSKEVTYDNYADEEISVAMDPLTKYYLKFTANGKTFEISGDATASECTDQSAEAAYFMQAIRGIANFYRNTEEYKSMPEAEGGYE